MRIVLAILISLVTVCGVAATAPAPAITAKVIRFTDALEANPLSGDADAMRQWLLEWLTETEDFTVTVCNILGPIPGDKSVPYGPELLLQQMFGNVVYQIRNPDQKEDVRTQIAGVESVLKAYAAILSKDPKAHVAYFDNLLAEQKKGRLKEYMTPIIVKGCADNSGTQQSAFARREKKRHAA
jgi:hypothetical protein